MKPTIPTADQLRQSNRAIRMWIVYVEGRLHELRSKGETPNPALTGLLDSLQNAYSGVEDALGAIREFDDL